MYQRRGMEFKTSKTLVDYDQYLRATTHVLALVSLIYIMFLHSSSLVSFPFLLHSLKFYLSAIPLHSLDKSWVFLICNGILVIIANTPRIDRNDEHHDDLHLHAPEEQQVLLLESAPDDDDDERGGNVAVVTEETNEKEDENHHHECCWEDEEEEEEEQQQQHDEEQVEEIRINITGDDEENDANCEDPLEGLEEEEAVVEKELEKERMNLEKLSAEELKEKFEDFIWKMKEELRVEAQQQQQQQQHLVVFE